MEDFYSALASVLTTDISSAKKIYNGFNTNFHPEFVHDPENTSILKAAFYALPTAKITKNDIKNNTTNFTLFVINDNAGSGVSGVVTKNRTEPVVYKTILYKKSTEQIEDSVNKEFYYHRIFNEVIVQTLLQNDPVYGSNVCRLYKVYRVEDSVILKMEALETTLQNRLNLEVTRLSTEAFSDTVASVLETTFKMLDYFQNKYSFVHNDLHPDNLMTSNSGPAHNNLKFIDFGYSTATFGDVTIGEPFENSDQNLLVTRLRILPQYKNSYTPKFARILTDMMVLPDNEKPIKPFMNILKSNKTGGRKMTRKAYLKKSLRKHRAYGLRLGLL
jgi:serine/threonine protein kinase